MSKDQKTAAERKFSARLRFRHGGRTQEELPRPKKILSQSPKASFFSTPHTLAVNQTEDNYFFTTPSGNGTYAIVINEGVRFTYDVIPWLLGCGLNLTEPGILGYPFWYACSPGIGSIYTVNETLVTDTFPPDLLCLKTSCPPAIGGGDNNGPPITLPPVSFTPPSLTQIAIMTGIFIAVVYGSYRSCNSSIAPPAPVPVPVPAGGRQRQEEEDLEIDEVDPAAVELEELMPGGGGGQRR